MKKIISMTLVLATLSGPLAQASGESSIAEKVRKTAFEVLYFGGPAAFLGIFAEPFLAAKDMKMMKAHQDDAKFFQLKVIAVEGNEFSIYEKVEVKIDKDDVVTVKRMVKNGDLSSIQDVVLDTKNQTSIVLDNNDAMGATVNGRILISEDLVQSHAAAQRVFRSKSDYTGAKFKESVNALNLNAMALN